MGRYIPFDDVSTADLQIDATYGSLSTDMTSEPLNAIFRCGNRGGFRQKRVRPKGPLSFVVLFSTLSDPDWPDVLDMEEGLFTYYGDNKKPGHDLHQTKRGGNRILAAETFGLLLADQPNRSQVPPFFIFTQGGSRQDVVFRGLAAPGSPALGPTDQLVALWKMRDGQRFQNYKAHFSILNEAVIKRAWIDDLLAGRAVTENTPAAWLDWIVTGQYRVLRAAPTLSYRTRTEQMPAGAREEDMVAQVYAFYRENPHGFERCAGELFRLLDSNVVDYELTRPWRDGGRDAIGRYRIGSVGEPVKVEFALEAKCYEPGKSSVGVREMSRLISRLQHRQFGVMVTTSYVHQQAYEEVTADGHPVLMLAARDIAQALTRSDYSDVRKVERWLRSIA